MAEVVVSSKGQVIIPSRFREELKWKRGTKLNAQKTFNGVIFFPVPKKPLLALEGILEKTGISSSDVKKSRKEDMQKYEKESL
ncbi:MAG: AbrB/MazE/SpoVT family DNA-binding domain-containing protein [archaeon]|nr:AbrB/MazE/SpoVT family DNA-binding domain-containing protein [archaeon]